jgi:clan AA aspartic protease (TIGR02281 family)
MALSKRTFSKSCHPKMMMRAFLILMAQMLLWLSPGFTAMYRCHDQSGTSVLTDNPAQLKGCSRLESSIVSTPHVPRNPLQPTDVQNVSRTEFPQNSSEQSDSSLAQESNQDSNKDSDITIPLEKIGGSFVVQVNLNQERTAHLIVDTGASMTVLSTNIAIDLGILGTTDTELLTVNTAGGSVQVNMNYLSSLTVGNAQAHNVAVAIHDLPDIPEQIEGLLGMSFLKHFLITLDAEHARLILRPKPSS